jgi:hypothetical protein
MKLVSNKLAPLHIVNVADVGLFGKMMKWLAQVLRKTTKLPTTKQ